MAMMQTKGLYKSHFVTEKQPNEPASLANGASKGEKKNHKMLKDAYEKEIADIKEKRNIVWCHLALTLDATILMLMRHDCVGDDGLEAFAREVSECRDADSGDFGGTACSTETRDD